MELVNKVLQGYVDGELKDIAPSTMSDNVFLSSNNSETIDTGLITTYAHTRTGTVNNFVGTGPNGRAKMTADVEAGDTFTVNGAPVTAYIGAKDAAVSMAGSAWNGKWISFIVDGATLNFNSGESGRVTYSSTETWTGEYIDVGEGPEKIYCKVFSGQIDPSQTPNIFPNVVSDWKRTVSLSVQVNNGVRNFTYIENSAQNTPAWGSSYMVATLYLGNLMLTTGTEIANTNFYAIMKYTKTSG